MGVLVGLAALVIVWLTVWSFTSLQATPSMALAIRTGLVLLVVGQGLGGAIVANGVAKTADHTPRRSARRAPSAPLVG